MSGIAAAPARLIAAELDLHAAWQRVGAKAGMAGVDRISVGRFRLTERALLRGLESRLARQDYRCLPLRAAEAEKKNGARRLLLVPCVCDRIAQTAAAQWLGQRWNGGFDASSYAYRPGLGRDDAFRRLDELRAAGYGWGLHTDIRSFFDSIPHDLLLARLQTSLGERSPLLEWIRDWVAAPVWDGLDVTRIARGVPQGSPLSPLLANYYLDAFDQTLRRAGAKWIRYADDVLLLARTPFELAEIRQVAETALAELQLALNPEKTRIAATQDIFRFLGAEIRSDGILLPFRKPSAKMPVYVAPPMPSALLRAFRAGLLNPRVPFVWSGALIRVPPPEPPKLRMWPDNLLDRLRKRPL